jgi:hypothetical protein
MTSFSLAPPPRDLPTWARRWRGPAYGVAAAAATFAALQLAFSEGGLAPLPPTIVAAAFLVMAVVEMRRRWLLRHGVPTVAVVSDVITGRGTVRLAYRFEEFEGVSALYLSDCVRIFGRVPTVGEALLVVCDPRNRSRSRVWGPAPDASVSGEEQRGRK